MTLPADTYGIEIPPVHADAPILTITVVSTPMTRDWRERPLIFDAAAVAPDRLLSGLRRFDPARPWTPLPLRP